MPLLCGKRKARLVPHAHHSLKAHTWLWLHFWSYGLTTSLGVHALRMTLCECHVSTELQLRVCAHRGGGLVSLVNWWCLGMAGRWFSRAWWPRLLQLQAEPRTGSEQPWAAHPSIHCLSVSGQAWGAGLKEWLGATVPLPGWMVWDLPKLSQLPPSLQCCSG